jgi:hypothetical protein
LAASTILGVSERDLAIQAFWASGLGIVLGAVLGALILGFIFYAAAHTWLVRPFINLIDRDERFPFLDRVMPAAGDRIAGWRYERSGEYREFLAMMAEQRQLHAVLDRQLGSLRDRREWIEFDRARKDAAGLDLGGVERDAD